MMERSAEYKVQTHSWGYASDDFIPSLCSTTSNNKENL